jgi:cysteine desulfurase
MVHTDAVQALGKVRLDFAALGVHAMSLSAHKIYGPKGVGALVLDKRVELLPQMTGGGHEKGLRAGTENVPGIVGFAAACELANGRMEQDEQRLRLMRDELEAGVALLGGVIFGSSAQRLANTSYFAFPGIEGETLLMTLDRAGFAVASGSACASGSTEPSPVLLAMGVEPELARGAIRVSLGRSNSMQQIEEFVRVLQVELERLRTLSAVAVM